VPVKFLEKAGDKDNERLTLRIEEGKNGREEERLAVIVCRS
jgi:hypothetical protein